jgi:hypothetical protein
MMENFLDTNYDEPTSEWCGCYGPHEKNSLPSESRVSRKSILFSLLFFLLVACTPQISAPSEDSDLTNQIIFQSSEMFIETFGCEPEPIYEKNQDGSIYIGVIGWCTESAIGAYYPPFQNTEGIRIEAP